MKYILLLGMLLLLAGCQQQNTGTLVMKLTDAPAGADITAATVTISNVQVHMAAADEEENATSDSWETVVSGPVTYDLLQLKDAAVVLGNETLKAGKYTQIRLTVDKAIVTVNGEEQELTIPSKTVKLVRPFTIVANETTTLTLDFDAMESIKQAGDKYVLQPTIKVTQE
jgi:hypothetical protein